jgi:hypothetical protein
MRTLLLLLASTTVLADPDAICRSRAAQTTRPSRTTPLNKAALQFQQALARCAGPGVGNQTARAVGLANVDYTRAARAVLDGKLSPNDYLAISRDRSRKLNVGLKSDAWLNALGRGDRDGDLVPDDRDKCPGSPDLTPTDASGCPPKEPPTQGPSPERVQAVLASMGMLIPPSSCDGAAPTTAPRALTIGYDHLSWTAGPCKLESNKELCFDHADNNCNGLVDEGCPNWTEPNLQLLVRATPGVANCAYFYEFDGTLSASDQAAAPTAIHFVMQATQGSVEGANLRFSFGPGAKGSAATLRLALRQYTDALWRVRVIDGAGRSTVWSDFIESKLENTRVKR